MDISQAAIFWEPTKRESCYSVCKLSLKPPVPNTVPPHSPLLPSVAVLTASFHPRLALSCSGLTLTFRKLGILCWGGAEQGVCWSTTHFQPIFLLSSHLLPRHQEHFCSPILEPWVGPGDTSASFLHSMGHLTLCLASLSPTCFLSFKSFAHIPPPLSSTFLFVCLF